MISASEARKQSDEKQTQTFMDIAEKAIQTAVDKGAYYCILEDTYLKNIPDSAIKQLTELGYSIEEYESQHYYTDTISNIRISWEKK